MCSGTNSYIAVLYPACMMAARSSGYICSILEVKCLKCRASSGGDVPLYIVTGLVWFVGSTNSVDKNQTPSQYPAPRAVRKKC